MKSTSDYIRLLKQFKESKAASYGIQKIGLFGSVARGEQQEGSDVDVCFEGNAIGLFKLSALKSELEELFGTTVDLLRMRKQLDDTILKDSVMKDLIYVWTGKETSIKNIDKISKGSIFSKYPSIPWKEIMKQRDLIAHHYFRIDADSIYATIKEDLPYLSDVLVQIKQSEFWAKQNS